MCASPFFTLHYSDGLLGRVHRVTKSDGMSRTTTYNGFIAYFFDEENHRSMSTVDFLGRVVRKETYSGTGPSYPLYAYTDYTYDGAGRLLTTKQNGNSATTITITYDLLGRKVQMVDPDTGSSGSAGT
jgi:YD repeat-containing protein